MAPPAVDAVTRGRQAYEQRAWADAYDAFSRASAEGLPLDAEDVERLAVASGLTGHEDDAIEAFGRAHQLRLDAGDIHRAARAAFWAAMRSFSLGEMARGGGWLARAQRLINIDDGKEECVECGYLRLPLVFRFTAAGDYASARAAANEAARVGDRFGDCDLRTLARSFEGRALIRDGKIAEGLALLDEAMVELTSATGQQQHSPMVMGIVYCGVIAACQQSYALDRAREWTTVLTRWCRDQPQIVTFAGQCLIHRSEIMQLEGAWPEAVEEARQAFTRLAKTRDVGAGNALYQEGEIHRLRGELPEAERAYGLASERGRDPQPGLALLRLSQGRVDLAAAATRRALSTTNHPLERSRLLPAHVEIMLAAGDLDEARRSADELCAIAEDFGMEILTAMAQHAKGAVVLAEGDARNAIEPLRIAQQVWQRAGAPYLGARIRLVMARAYKALGDEDGAVLELDAARKIFTELGAASDLAAMAATTAISTPTPPPPLAQDKNKKHGLSARELEVLVLVASGKTNKLIAKELFVSEKTVDRHVSNIFAKLDVSTRSAATAWAYENGLISAQRG